MYLPMLPDEGILMIDHCSATRLGLLVAPAASLECSSV